MTRAAIEVLARDRASGPSKAVEALAAALTDANLMFHYYVENHPSQFEFARRKLIWPGNRYGPNARAKKDPYEQLVRDIELGADLPKMWGVKSKVRIDWGSFSVIKTWEWITRLSPLRQDQAPPAKALEEILNWWKEWEGPKAKPRPLSKKVEKRLRLWSKEGESPKARACY